MYEALSLRSGSKDGRRAEILQGDQKKTGQSLIFKRNNAAKFTKICM